MFGRIAVVYVEWAGDYYQRTVLDWSLLDGAESAFAFADALAETPLSTAHWTSLSGAIDYAVPLFDDNGFEGFRRVIDISGDGHNNRGRPVEQRATRRWRRHHHQRPADRQRPAEPLGRRAADQSRRLLRAAGDRRSRRLHGGGRGLHLVRLGDPLQAAARDRRRHAARAPHRRGGAIGPQRKIVLRRAAKAEVAFSLRRQKEISNPLY